MKKHFFLFVLAVAFLFSISSCSQDNGTDLTTDIIGNYTGTVSDSTVNVSSNTTTGVSFQVTKSDNTHITVTFPSSTGDFSYNASLTQASNGVLINVQNATVGVATIQGYAYSFNGTACNGAYNPTTKQFASIVQEVQSGSPNVIETVTATHQ